ncbi:MAG: preprotein translocase subunit SecG [Sphingopyxis sp.]|nr:preprotein translocase subunit SecG [Sphingopyxis sp.]
MSNLFTFLLVVQAVVAAAMIGVILMQKSEGGGLGVGGSPAGLLSARGAADFLTRATTILATAFVGLSIILAAMASVRGGNGGTSLDTSLSKSAAPATGDAAPGSLTGPAPAPAAGAPAQQALPSDDPLAAAAAAAAADTPPAEPKAPAKK